jgi:pleiotropic regulator 1
MAETASAQPPSAVDQIVRNSAKRTREIFAADFASPAALDHAANAAFTITPSTASPSTTADQVNVACRIRNEYEHVRELPPALAVKMAAAASTAAERRKKIKSQNAEERASDPKMQKMIEGASEKADRARDSQSMQLALRAGGKGAAPNASGPTPMQSTPSSALVRKDTVRQARPEWHRPWKVARVMAGHLGWVRSLCVDPDNQFIVTGAGDRTIKLWDLASSQLRLTLTGHISAVRGVEVSSRHPYLFSCGEDKMVKCWDLETNKVIRHYHGHLSGVYSLALHPTLDVLVTGGRDVSTGKARLSSTN